MTKQEQKARFELAVSEAHKYGPWTLQRQDYETKEWKNIGPSIWGRREALQEMNKFMASQGGEWRVLPKNEADKYREGLKQGKEIGRRTPTIPKGLYLPERL